MWVCGEEALTVGVDAAEEVLVQAHLVEALEVLLPLGEERLAALAAVEAAEEEEEHTRGCSTSDKDGPQDDTTGAFGHRGNVREN